MKIRQNYFFLPSKMIKNRVGGKRKAWEGDPTLSLAHCGAKCCTSLSRRGVVPKAKNPDNEA